MKLRFINILVTVALSLAAPRLAASPDTAAMGYTLTAPFHLLLRWIPGGEFRMGDLSGVGQKDEQPVRTVNLAGFWMMSTEATVDMFRSFVASAGYDMPSGCGYFSDGWRNGESLNWRSPGFTQGPDHPVTCVSWQDANAFARWLSRETGLAFYLPSEAQWEYAARAGEQARYGHGNDPAQLCGHANGADQRALADYPDFDANDCDDGYTRSAPVASFPSNAWGLHDLTGNVWEWVADCWATDYTAAPADGTAYLRGDCERRAYRGGAYGDVPFYLRIALRNRGKPTERRDDVGFRLVMTRWN